MKKLLTALCCVLFLLSFSGCSAADKRCECTYCAGEVDLATYSISYYTNGGELESLNPVAYNSLTPSFTLSAPKRSGYRFLGWSRSEDLSTPSLSLEVPKGTTGNLSFFAVWGELYSIRVDSASPEFFTVEYVSGPVLSGETATVRIYTAEPVDGLNWWGLGTTWQAPESCVYDEGLGCFVARFTLIGNATVMVEALV